MHHSQNPTLEKSDVQNDLWQKAKSKAKCVGFFNRLISDKSRRREMLTSFMKRMKTCKENDENELCQILEEYTLSESPSNIFTKRARSPVQTTRRIPCPEVPTYVKYEIPRDPKCALCNEIFPVFYEHQALPCRICNDVFHKECLMKCEDLTFTDKQNVDLARSNIGWSCPNCANISLLLSTDEVNHMTFLFDKIDFNQDMEITLPEYLHHHSRRRSLTNARGQLLPSEKDRLTRTFNYMDMNKDGKLDWWEFVNQESKSYLAEKNKYDLVDLLTMKELCAAKAAFNSMDKDGDGKIKEYEIKDAFRKWYRQFENIKSNLGNKIMKDSDSLDHHVDVFTQLMMESAIENTQTEVIWEDFLLEQALYIICARPNICI